MKTQIWILLAIVAGTVQAAADCARKDEIFASKSTDNPTPWIVLDWRTACANLTVAAVRSRCLIISTNISIDLPKSSRDQILFNFKKSAIAFVNEDSANRQYLLNTQIHKDADNFWGTYQELVNCLAADCGMLLIAGGEPGELTKISESMRAECVTAFGSDVNELMTCAYTAGQMSADIATALRVLNTYTMNGTNTKRMDLLAKIKIESWGGTLAQSLACAGTSGDCNRLPPLLVSISVDDLVQTRFTVSMRAECAIVFSTAADVVNLADCMVCGSQIAAALAIPANQATPINTMVNTFRGCTDRTGWIAAFQTANPTIASWGTITQALNCSGFVAPTTPVPGSTGSTAAPESAACQARRELLQKENAGEYKIIAPLLAQCQFMNSTEKTACESATNTMRTIANSTSTEVKKLEDISNALTNYGIISPFKALTLQTTDIGSWNASPRNYFRFITCQSPGSCKLSQMMFATLPSGGSYASDSILIACERNNTDAACTTLMNEIKRCTMGAMNFMPATEADRLVRAQFIVANSTTVRLDRNAPFGEWGTVDQFLKCTLP